MEPNVRKILEFRAKMYSFCISLAAIMTFVSMIMLATSLMVAKGDWWFWTICIVLNVVSYFHSKKMLDEVLGELDWREIKKDTQKDKIDALYGRNKE